MAKVFKLEMYVVDVEGTFENMTPSQVSKELKSTIDYEHWTMSEVASLQTSKEFEWDEDSPINNTKATLEDYEAYFNKGEK